MKNFLIQLILFLLLSLIALQRPAAQGNSDAFFTTRRNALGLRLGFNRLDLLDRNSSALIYRGNIPVVGIGLAPAVEVKNLKEDLLAGKDAALERAIELLK